ncbi:MAG: hypothetical protein MRJ93_05785 [Nitrososphaeraceae archaeon]|nr:hypothetical protein [Nitrososphaeraceae archaeon]
MIVASIIILFLFSIFPNAFAQFTSDVMIKDMRTTHDILEQNVDQVISLIKNNNTAEAINFLEGVKIKVNHMNSMFDDLVWELSNRGH